MVHHSSKSSIRPALHGIELSVIIQSTEPGLDAPVIHIMRDSEDFVEVPLSLELIICFDNRVEKVCGDYGNMYAPPVLRIYCRAELRLGVTDTSDGRIVYRLNPAADQLHYRLVTDFPRLAKRAGIYWPEMGIVAHIWQEDPPKVGEESIRHDCVESQYFHKSFDSHRQSM